MKTQPNLRTTPHPRRGFTLVELLVVITIIGAIAALTIPAIGMVMRSVRTSAMKFEITNIETGINDYKNKHGDYPPDFSDWSIVKRHYLKIFPDIANSELNLLYRLCDNVQDNDTNNQMTTNPLSNDFNPTAMDRAEAIVWSLGGFSSDPQYPFTGAGGPLVRLPNTGNQAVDDPSAYEYNTTRNSPMVDFEPSQLTVKVPGNPTAQRAYNNRYESDEVDADGLPNDLFPAYVLREEQSPIVYFDARTYARNVGTTSNPAFNGYARPSSDATFGFDGVRPVYSLNPGLNPSPSSYGSIGSALTGWEFVNPSTFQVMAPGLDGLYGELLDVDPTNDPANGPGLDIPVYFQMGGAAIRPDPAATSPTGLEFLGVNRFDVTGIPQLRESFNPFKDNLANFIDGTFEDELE